MAIILYYVLRINSYWILIDILYAFIGFYFCTTIAHCKHVIFVTREMYTRETNQSNRRLGLMIFIYKKKKNQSDKGVSTRNVFLVFSKNHESIICVYEVL